MINDGDDRNEVGNDGLCWTFVGNDYNVQGGYEHNNNHNLRLEKIVPLDGLNELTCLHWYILSFFSLYLQLVGNVSKWLHFDESKSNVRFNEH